MKHNLILSGVPSTAGDIENTEDVMKTLIKEWREIDDAENISFQNVHCLLPRREEKPKIIIPKLSNHSDLEQDPPPGHLEPKR